MTSIHLIDDASAPAIGDIRAAGDGDVICVRSAATSRRDFPRYWEAVGVALVRGAVVRVMNREEI